jgi:hypothetical protein
MKEGVMDATIVAITFKWLWSLIKLPITLTEVLKELKEVNSKMESPSKYSEDLNWAKQIYDLKIKQAKEERTKLLVNDSEKQQKLDVLISELKTAKEKNQELIDQVQTAQEDRDLFFEGFKSMRKKNERLSEMLVKNQSILPPLNSPLANAIRAKAIAEGRSPELGWLASLVGSSTIKTDKTDLI